ncbi:MAG: hypothetical protein H3Z52_14705 [archaeon]|nr:hypothetical protein [archaeon]MCP8322166.1 hypothetical protein [archaeon]
MGKAKRKKAEKLKKAERVRKFRRFGLLSIIVLASIIATVAVAYIAFNPTSSPPPTNGPPPEGELKAAILDSLYIMDPNQDFLTQANQTLSNSGFKVDIYIGGNVTVELFRKLPSLGYKLIVLRVHTAYDPNLVAFFTGTYADSGYFSEKLAGWVRIGRVEGKRFYAVTPSLIEEASQGRFQNSIVIVDSCYGLNSTSMASAFIKKGASAYIAWDQGVYPNYSDDATLELINHLLEGKTVEQAVILTPKDPSRFGSELSYYPISGGNVKLIG